MLTRRAVLGALAATPAALAAPAIAQPAATLRFVPQADLSSLDPIWTTGYVVRNHGYMVYDTLYALDSGFNVRPQMAEAHEVADNGLTWRIRLRPGLRFHDGAPVRAADCAASIRRWAARSSFGQSLAAQANEIAAEDDRTLRVRLKTPFPLLAEALGTVSSPIPFIMPERIATADAGSAITEATGSGPFRFIASEWVAGSRAAYSKFDGYVPRDEPPDAQAGGKRARVARIEWTTMPDAGTAVAALQAGEIDWLEQPSTDLVGLVLHDPNVTVTTIVPGGVYALLRFNQLYPPFDDVLARQAVLAAVDQATYMQAIVGGSAAASRVCKAFIPCGMPLSTGAGSEAMADNLEQGRALLRQSRYDGRPVVIITPSDMPAINAMGEVTTDLLTRLGMRVDHQVMDWGTLLTRRNSQKPPAEGGWNIFHTTAVSPEFMTPATHLALRGNGRAAWAGWPTDERIETLRQEWFAAPDDAAQREVVAAIERTAFADVPYVPLGQYDQPTAYRLTVTETVKATAPVMWNLRKT